MAAAHSVLKSNENKNEPAFFARSPQNIKHSKQPPAIDKKYAETPTQEYAKSQGIEWTDSMLLTPHLRDALWQDQTCEKKAISSVEERLHHPLDCLVICDINSEVGKGVFLAHDAKPLPAGTVIGIYAGKLESSISDFLLGKENDCSMALTCEEHENSILSKTVPHLKSNADQAKNITTFIQDAPDDFELKKMQEMSGKPFAKDNIASANIFVFPGVYKGCPISYLVTSREIMPGEQLLYPYQGNFWNKKKRCVFNKDGLVIGSFKSPNEIQLNAEYKPTKEMSAPRLDLPITKKVVLELQNPKTDTFDASERLAADVLWSLDVYANRYVIESAEWKYINRLRDSFNSSNQIAVRFNNLHHGLSDASCQALLKKIGTLRSELIFHMRKFQATKTKTLLKVADKSASLAERNENISAKNVAAKA